jgi:hypothetical protein
MVKRQRVKNWATVSGPWPAPSSDFAISASFAAISRVTYRTGNFSVDRRSRQSRECWSTIRFP